MNDSTHDPAADSLDGSTHDPAGPSSDVSPHHPAPARPRALWFHEVEVRRARGIGLRDGFRLPDLVPGINLISGSNGSGKSTTALAIQELLWPGETDLFRPSLAGILRDGDSVLDLEVEAGFPTLRRDGREEGVAAFAPAESRTRHHLALPELLHSTDRVFAKRVADASRGGYDLTAAARELGFTPRPSSPRARRQALDEAQRDLRKARQLHEDLLLRSNRVSDLERAADEAREAEREARGLERLLAWWDAAAECRTLEAKMAAFPPGIARLRDGDERDRLKALRHRRRRILDRLHDAHREQDEAVARLRETGLPEEGIDGVRLAAWTAESDELAALHTRRTEARRVAAGARGEAERRRRELGTEVSEAALEALDHEAREALEALADEAEALRLEGLRLRVRRQELETEASRNGPQEAETIPSDTLRDGIRTLGRWLKAPSPPGPDPREDTRRGLRLRLRVAVGLSALLFMVLAVVSDPLWTLGLLVAAALLVGAGTGAGTSGPAAEGSDDRAVHRRSFESAGLPEPERWDEGAVAAHMDTLFALLQQSIQDEAMQTNLTILAREEEAYLSRRGALERSRRDLARRLGIPLGSAGVPAHEDSPGGGVPRIPGSPAASNDLAAASGELPLRWLPDFVRSVAGWREARARAAAAEGEADALDDAWERRFHRLLEELAPVTAVEVATGAAIQGVVTELGRRNERRGAAVRARMAAHRSMEELEEELGVLEQEEAEFWARLGLEPGDEATLTEWVEQGSDWTRARDELLRAQAVRDGIRRESGLPTPEPGLTRLDIQDRLAEAQARAQRRDELMEEITAIRTEVRSAAQGTGMADLLARRDAAMAALSDERERAEAEVAGFHVTEFIRAEESERSRPAVLRRASRLLSRFTRGLLALEVQDIQGEPEFRVRRGDGPSRPLDELSGGERIQTLMAVRLAFLEEEESVQLPLLLDETLATSDDDRIARIVETVMEIARGGRQVFCFTAQPSEVAKWRMQLEGTGADVPFRHLDLDQVRGRERADSFPPTLTSPRPLDVPRPAGDGLKEYGRRLAEAGLLDGIDPWARSAHRLHLWHLVEDPEVLHRLLADGIQRWGPLGQLAAGAPEFIHGLGVDEANLDALASRARAVELATELWRIGRSPPVDREVLTEAAGISEIFLDRVVALATDCAGDGAVLIERLAAGELSRWRQDNTELLREWLEAEGYLDSTPRLTPEELRVRLLEGCRRELGAGSLDTAFLDRVIHGLPLDRDH